MELNKKILAGILLVSIIIIGVFGTFTLSIMQFATHVPGPEGARVEFYGVQIGSDIKAYVGDAAPDQTILDLPDEEAGIFGRDIHPGTIKWGSPDYTNPTIYKTEGEYKKDPKKPIGGFGANGPWWWYKCGTGEIKIEIDRPAAVDVDRRGYPLGYGDKVVELEYYVKVEEEGNKVTFKKIVGRIIPFDWVMQISSVPDGVYTWKNLHLWFKLDTIIWRNAFTKTVMNDPNPPPNTTLETFEYRGAFPILAWIGEYDPMVWGEKDHTGKERGETEHPPAEAYGYVNLNPDLKGRILTLYTNPWWPATESVNQMYLTEDIDEAKKITGSEDQLQEEVSNILSYLPDPDFALETYFPISLNKYGPYVQPVGSWPDIYREHDIYFPASYYRMRSIFCVYGEFVYLWTKQEEQRFDKTFENRTSIVYEVRGPWANFWANAKQWWQNLWRNPMTWFWTIIILIIVIAVIIILLSIFAPWIFRIFERKK